jgi:hypothetical protein
MIQLLADNKIPELASRDADIERELMQRLLAENTSTVMGCRRSWTPDEDQRPKKEAWGTGNPRDGLLPPEHYGFNVLMFGLITTGHALHPTGVRTNYCGRKRKRSGWEG